MRHRGSLFLIVTILLVLPVACVAVDNDDDASYVLGAGDILQLNVIQQPSLDRTLEILPGGAVVFPLIGEIQLGGLTISSAETLVQQKLQLFNNELVDITLSVAHYNAMYIYVLGQVVHPGRYSFSSTPNVWDVIRIAGGTNAEADVTAIRVISQSDQSTRSMVFDLTPLYQGQEPPPDLDLQPGDTVIVPGRGQAITPSMTSANVFGAVAMPGVYPLAVPTRLMSVLMMAGAPTAESDLEDVSIVHPGRDGALNAERVNLLDFIRKADPDANPLVYPGDTIRVSYAETGLFMRVYPVILGTLTAAATIYLIVDRANN